MIAKLAFRVVALLLVIRSMGFADTVQKLPVETKLIKTLWMKNGVQIVIESKSDSESAQCVDLRDAVYLQGQEPLKTTPAWSSEWMPWVDCDLKDQTEDGQGALDQATRVSNSPGGELFLLSAADPDETPKYFLWVSGNTVADQLNLIEADVHGSVTYGTRDDLGFIQWNPKTGRLTAELPDLKDPPMAYRDVKLFDNLLTGAGYSDAACPVDSKTRAVELQLNSQTHRFQVARFIGIDDDTHRPLCVLTWKKVKKTLLQRGGIQVVVEADPTQAGAGDTPFRDALYLGSVNPEKTQPAWASDYYGHLFDGKFDDDEGPDDVKRFLNLSAASKLLLLEGSGGDGSRTHFIRIYENKAEEVFNIDVGPDGDFSFDEKNLKVITELANTRVIFHGKPVAPPDESWKKSCPHADYDRPYVEFQGDKNTGDFKIERFFCR